MLMDEPLVYDDALIRRILKEVNRIAMVGASASEMRPSYFAMLYLLNKGYEIDPVNPHHAGQTIQGRTVYPDLLSLPERPDMVQIFRRSEEVPPLVEAAIGIGARVIWMQLGVRHEAAAAQARAAGLDVIMDRCPKIEHGRLFGEIGWLGVNRGVLSAKRGVARQLSTTKGRLL
jgi:predicted CoA-binding protein